MKSEEWMRERLQEHERKIEDAMVEDDTRVMQLHVPLAKLLREILEEEAIYG